MNARFRYTQKAIKEKVESFIRKCLHFLLTYALKNINVTLKPEERENIMRLS